MKVIRSKKASFPLAAKAEKAIKEAVNEAMIDHKRTGDPIAVWKNGKVAWIPARKIPVKLSRKKR
jgi:hypothetical protein